MWDFKYVFREGIQLTPVINGSIMTDAKVYKRLLCKFVGKKMIDIHSHILYGVDDGAKDIAESVEMLRDAREQGVTAMIATPHYRHGMFSYPNQIIEEHFVRLKREAEELGMQLYLGTEQHVNSMTVEYIESGRCHTLADTSYVLVEYKYETSFLYIKESVQDLLRHGYIPIVAHIERYACMQKLVHVEFLREIGAMIQVNADAIIGKNGFCVKGYTKKLLKQGFVDFVGSDAHGIKERKSNMGKCREYLYRKYDHRYVDRILEKNARELLQSKEQ